RASRSGGRGWWPLLSDSLPNGRKRDRTLHFLGLRGAISAPLVAQAVCEAAVVSVVGRSTQRNGHDLVNLCPHGVRDAPLARVARALSPVLPREGGEGLVDGAPADAA